MSVQLEPRFAELIRATRSYRRFHEDVRLGEDFLCGLVDLARVCANGANAQRLRFRLVSEPAACEAVFATLAWAGYLTDWTGPEPGERPAGYVIVCAERPEPGRPAPAITEVDAGIAAQTMLLAARASSPSVGGCLLKAFTPELANAAGIDAEQYEVKLVVALGVPAEEVRLEPLSASPDGSIRYWRDAEGTHHVPKRALEDVLI